MASVEEWVDVEDDDGWIDVPPVVESVADAARRRLAARGLTPEMVKAGGAGSPMPQEGRGPLHIGGDPEVALMALKELLGMDDGSGIQTNLKTADRGLGGELLHAFNPVDMAKGAFKFTRDVTDPFGLAHEGTIIDTIPPLPTIAKESYRRGEQGESTAGMYADPIAQAAMLGVGGAVSKLGKLAATPARLAAQESQYGAALSTPLTETLASQMAPEMMQRLGVITDPAKAATVAEAAAERATAARSAIPKPRGSIVDGEFQPATAGDAARATSRGQLFDEARFQENVKTIMEALPEQRSAGNILLDGAKAKKSMMMTAGVATAIVPSHLLKAGIAGVSTAVAAAQVLKDLAKSPMWKTAGPVVKRSIGKAMAAGDYGQALELGAGVATGELADDEYGHRAAVKALSAETEALPSPELRRQAIAGKKYSYIDKEGRETPIPHNLVHGFVNAKVLTEGESPLSAWLNSMGKQGLIKPGGSIAINGVVARKGSPGPASPYAEWPAKGEVDENSDLILSTPPGRLLPERFANARKVTLGSPLHGVIEQDPGSVGLYGLEFDPAKRPTQTESANTVLIARRAGKDSATYTHEIGHSVDVNDLTPAERAEFGQIYDSTLNALRAEFQTIDRNSPNANAQAAELAKRYPRAIVKAASDFRDNPERAKMEAFAELFGQFVANPTPFKNTYPQIFDWYERMSGVNYLGGKMNRVTR